MINGELCDDHQIISAYILRFYEDLFGDSRTSKPSLHFIDELLVPSVMVEQSQRLVGIPLDDEVKATTFDLSPTSAPGRDGFRGCFYQVAWDIVCTDIINVVGYYFFLLVSCPWVSTLIW